jgi:hypothetical protein
VASVADGFGLLKYKMATDPARVWDKGVYQLRVGIDKYFKETVDTGRERLHC